MSEKPCSIVVVGDSLSDLTSHCWPLQLERLDARLRLHNNAHGGWTTMSFFRPHLFPQAFPDLPRETALGILLLGTNNLFEAGGGSEAAVAEACTGIERLAAFLGEQAPSIRILLLAPPRLCLAKADWTRETGPRRLTPETPLYLELLGEAYAAMAMRREWGFLDLRLRAGLEDADFQDAAHPDAGGHAKLAAVIHPAVMESLRLEPLPLTYARNSGRLHPHS